VLEHERANGFEVIAPDGVDELTSLDEPRPAAYGVAPREGQLRIGELRVSHRDFLRMRFLELRNRIGISAAHLTEQFLRLALELFEVGPYRKMTVCEHDEPPFQKCPGPLASGEKEVRENRI
jgi:hypothetical protein